MNSDGKMETLTILSINRPMIQRKTTRIKKLKKDEEIGQNLRRITNEEFKRNKLRTWKELFVIIRDYPRHFL